MWTALFVAVGLLALTVVWDGVLFVRACFFAVKPKKRGR